jgi:hypothetical protein
MEVRVAIPFEVGQVSTVLSLKEKKKVEVGRNPF